MNLESFAAIGEAVGGITVLVSLIYLSFQMKQSNKIATAVAQQNIFAQMGTTHDAAMIPEVAELRARMRDVKYDDLDDVEKERLEAHVYSIMNIWASVQTSYNQGLISQNVLSIYITDVANEMARFPAIKSRLVHMWRKYPMFMEWPIWNAIREISDEYPLELTRNQRI